MVKELRSGEELDIAELCQGHAEGAVDTLVKATKARKSPWNAKVAAANSLLDRAGGKPGTKEPEKTDGSLTIIVNNLFLDGKPQQVPITMDATEVVIIDDDDAPTQEEIEAHAGTAIVVDPLF